MRERVLAALVVLALAGGLLGAVTAEDDDADDTPADAGEVALEPGPVRDRVTWVLQLVNDGIGEREIADVFAPSFLAAVPAEQVAALAAQQLRPAGPFTIAEIRRETSTGAVLVIQGPTGTSLKLSISLAAAPPHRIEGLLFEPAEDEQPKPTSWSELEQRLRDAAPDVAFLAAEIVDGTCRPVHAVDPDLVLPLGSAFKLYVLGAVADEVAAGRASWDEELTITDERRVHSSMTYGSTPAGTKVSLRDAAAAMISVSDNTATDLVMDRVGRAAVESQQAAMGMANPSRNEPFITTRELTYLKWIVSDDARAEYIAADRARREEILAALPDRGATSEVLLAVLGGPTELDDLEWFASPFDLCRAHVALQTKGDEVRRILSINTGRGIELDRAALPYVAFKGGSEPGVLGLSWYAEHRDGRKLFVGALLKNDDGHVATEVAIAVAAALVLF